MSALAKALLAVGGVALVVVVGAVALRTDGGPAAPPVGAPAVHCFADVCAAHPPDWDVEVGDTFLAFTHPFDPERVLGSVGRVNLRALIESAGGAWPAPPEEAVRAFFTLLGENQDAALEEGPTRLPDGSVEAAGRLEGLWLWYRLIPGADGDRGIGVEVRAPNRSWQVHADAWRDGLAVGGAP